MATCTQPATIGHLPRSGSPTTRCGVGVGPLLPAQQQTHCVTPVNTHTHINKPKRHTTCPAMLQTYGSMPGPCKHAATCVCRERLGSSASLFLWASILCSTAKMPDKHCTGVAAAASMQRHASRELHNTLLCPTHPTPAASAVGRRGLLGLQCTATAPKAHCQQYIRVERKSLLADRGKRLAVNKQGQLPKLASNPGTRPGTTYWNSCCGKTANLSIPLQSRTSQPHGKGIYHTTRGGSQTAVTP
jgi:hypothetical protein